MLELNKIYCGDCLELMKQIPDKSIDLVLTDPPYGTTSNEWDNLPDLEVLWYELKRVGKDNCAYVFTANQPFTSKLIISNMDWFKYCWAWNKIVPSGFLNSKKQPLKVLEDICVFYRNQCKYNPQFIQRTEKEIKEFKSKQSVKGNSTENYNSYNIIKTKNPEKKYPNNLISINSKERECNFKNRKHPTQKPIKLMNYLMETYSNENDLILDPFLGSGTTCVAAKQLKRNYIGIEISPKYCAIAEQRLRQDILL